MGWSLGAAMGAKLAHPEKYVINVMGDGAYGMVGMDLETAVRNTIPITTIVPNNSALGITKMNQKRYNMVDLSGDYAQVARGLGAYAEKVEKPSEIIPAIRRGLEANDSGKPALLEIIVKNEELPIYK